MSIFNIATRVDICKYNNEGGVFNSKNIRFIHLSAVVSIILSIFVVL